MHISSVIKISFCRISFSGHQNKFCACLDSIYGSRVILVMCKNGSDIRWHRLNSNQSKTNCPKNLNSDGLIVREMGPWPECIFRSLLQFLVYYDRFSGVWLEYAVIPLAKLFLGTAIACVKMWVYHSRQLLVHHQGPLSLTQINVIPNIKSNLTPSKVQSPPITFIIQNYFPLIWLP